MCSTRRSQLALLTETPRTTTKHTAMLTRCATTTRLAAPTRGQAPTLTAPAGAAGDDAMRDAPRVAPARRPTPLLRGARRGRRLRLIPRSTPRRSARYTPTLTQPTIHRCGAKTERTGRNTIHSSLYDKTAPLIGCHYCPSHHIAQPPRPPQSSLLCPSPFRAQRPDPRAAPGAAARALGVRRIHSTVMLYLLHVYIVLFP